MHIFFAFCLFFFLSISNAVPTGPKCKEFRESSKAHHKKQLLSRCLFDYLFEKAQNETMGSLLLMPEPSSSGRVNVKISKIEKVLHDEKYDRHKQSFNGIVSLNWSDSRLVWSPQIWGMSDFKLNYDASIWFPEPVGLEIGNSFDDMTFEVMGLNINAQGVVNLRLKFEMLTECQHNGGRGGVASPFAPATCCGRFGVLSMDEWRDYQLAPKMKAQLKIANHQQQQVTDLQILTATDAKEKFNWLMAEESSTSSSSSSEKLSTDSDGSKFLLCAKIQSSWALQKSQASTPIIGIALMTFVATFLGSIRIQLLVKLLAASLAFFCIENSVRYLTFMDLTYEMPNIYRFYGLTYFISLMSALTSLAAISIQSIERKFPPTHKFKLVAKFILKYFSLGSDQIDTDLSDEVTLSTTTKTSSYKEDWNLVILAVHNLCCIGLISVYGLVTLVLFA